MKSFPALLLFGKGQRVMVREPLYRLVSVYFMISRPRGVNQIQPILFWCWVLNRKKFHQQHDQKKVPNPKDLLKPKHLGYRLNISTQISNFQITSSIFPEKQWYTTYLFAKEITSLVIGLCPKKPTKKVWLTKAWPVMIPWPFRRFGSEIHHLLHRIKHLQRGGEDGMHGFSIRKTLGFC